MRKIRYSLLTLICIGMTMSVMAGGVREAHNAQDKYAPEAPVLQEIIAESSEEASLISEEVVHATAEHVAVTEPVAKQEKTTAYADMTKSEKKAARKDLKKELKTMRKNAKKNSSPAGEYAPPIVCVLFAIFIPPLGVALHEGITLNFWLCLLLTLLFFLPGMIFALIVVLSE